MYLARNYYHTMLFYVSYRRPDRHLYDFQGKDITFLLSYFKTPSIGPASGTDPAPNYYSAIQRSTDWAYPSTINVKLREL